MKANFYNRGQALTGILIVLVVVGLITGGLYFYLSNQIPEVSEITEKQEGEEIVPVCQNECSQTASKRCSGNGYQACGNYDTDNCLEWGSIIDCPANTICQNGSCIQQAQQKQKCADGTLYGQCSTNRPKYCDNGNLINKCSSCGCSSGQKCQADGSCIASPCIDNDNYCPWECNYWKLDNDCNRPQLYDLVASNDPNDYKGDIIHWNDTEWRNYQPLINRVNNLISGINNDYDKAVKIADWVTGSRTYGEPSPANQGKSVIEIFESKSGICMDAGILTTAMFRIAGFSARVVLPANAWHEYSEAFINNRWIGFDSTFNPSGRANIIDPISAITYTNKFLESKSEVKTHYTDINYNSSLENVSFYKVNIVPRTSLSSNWGFVYIPTTNRIIFENSGLDYSLIYNKTINIDWTQVKWEIKADNLSCSWYNCSSVASNNYSYNIQPVGILGYGTLNFRGESFRNTLEYTKNGFFKMALPEGKYKINYTIPFVGDIGYKYFEIKSNENIIILPNSLTKFPETKSKLFDLIIEALNSSIEGLSL